MEASCKAILVANTCSDKSRDMSVVVYTQIEFSHYLSQHKIKLPYWTGRGSVRRPFAKWATTTGKGGQGTLDWYQSFTATGSASTPEMLAAR